MSSSTLQSQAIPQSSALSSDVQRALQHAVGQANNAFLNPQVGGEKKKKHKKKRAREEVEEGVEETVDDVGEGGDVSERKKKKKKKKNHDEATTTASTTTSNDPPATDVDFQHPEASNSNEASLPKKKKKKSKSKVHKNTDASANTADIGTGTGTVETAPSDFPTMDPQTFLNAVVSAASATAQVNTSESQQTEDTIYTPHQPGYMPFPAPGAPVPPYAYPALGAPGLNGVSDDPFAALDLPPGFLVNASSEDLMNAVQSADFSKIANVLRTLGDAATAANLDFSSIPPHPHPHAAPAPPPIPPLAQKSAPSNAIRGVPSQASSSGQAGPTTRDSRSGSRAQSKRITNFELPAPDISENQQILASKWLSSQKLTEMAKNEGLVYKKGKFSAIEEQQLEEAIERYRAEKGMSEEDLTRIIWPDDKKSKDQAFWSEITLAVPMRPIIGVYHHVRRTRHPLKLQGKWVKSEDELLESAVLELGPKWEKVSARVGRMAQDCRDRYRNHIQNRSERNAGAWSKAEEAQLTEIVKDMTVNQGKDTENDVFWGVVSEKMGNKRGRQQCRIKWLDSLNRSFKTQGHKPRWGLQDSFILVHKVNSLNVRDDTEIDWKTLPDSNWNFFSPHNLQRRWHTMRHSIKGHENMTHAEIMDILLVKNTHLPPESSCRPRQIKQFTSAEAVADSDDEGDAVDAGSAAAVTANNSEGARQDSSSSSSSSDDDDSEE